VYDSSTAHPKHLTNIRVKLNAHVGKIKKKTLRNYHTTVKEQININKPVPLALTEEI
jgi:hypothetical protein